jgi:hypothetical protein
MERTSSLSRELEHLHPLALLRLREPGGLLQASPRLSQGADSGHVETGPRLPQHFLRDLLQPRRALQEHHLDHPEVAQGQGVGGRASRHPDTFQSTRVNDASGFCR